MPNNKRFDSLKSKWEKKEKIHRQTPGWKYAMTFFTVLNAIVLSIPAFSKKFSIFTKI